MAKYLITGGAGFIGSTIARELLDSGHEVIILDNLTTGKKENIPEGAELIEGDIRDFDTVKKACQGVEFISHHAAQISVPVSIENPQETLDVNAYGTLNILKAAVDNQIKKVVFASSSAVYGETKELPIKESQSLSPMSPYAVAKALSEYYCQTFANLYDLQVTIFRYFNVFGAGQDPNSSYAAAIPKFKRLKEEGKPITIFGDGSQTRDFISVSDVATANIKAFEVETGVMPINIGSGKAITIKELAFLISEDVIFADERLGDIKHSLSDISIAQELLNFQPKQTIKDYLS